MRKSQGWAMLEGFRIAAIGVSVAVLIYALIERGVSLKVIGFSALGIYLGVAVFIIIFGEPNEYE